MSGDQPPPTAPTRTVFLGSGGFAVPILDALASMPAIDVVGVVSAPDRPSGRRGEPTPVPVTRRVRELRLPSLQPARVRAAEAIAAIAGWRPELGVLADYGQIIPPALLDLPRHGILNVHPSALPRHRGASPIAATIASGDRAAAVSLIRMDEGLDTGPIIAGESWPLEGRETAPELEAEAARRGAALLVVTLGDWIAGRLPAIPQATSRSGAVRTRRVISAE